MAKNILIIDDDISLRDALKEIFEGMNYEVSVACDGKEGEASCRRTAADIIVTDTYIPGKDELETIREIKKEYPEAKIIVMSGIYKGQGDFFQVSRYLGAIACIGKTCGPDDIITIVNFPLDDNEGENRGY